MTRPEDSAKPAALRSQLRKLAEEEVRPTGIVVLYASFGVVRGRLSTLPAGQETSFASANVDGERVDANRPDGDGSTETLIEINDATVEHYHSHLPTASFVRLFIRTGDIQAFALASSQRQG